MVMDGAILGDWERGISKWGGSGSGFPKGVCALGPPLPPSRGKGQIGGRKPLQEGGQGGWGVDSIGGGGQVECRRPMGTEISLNFSGMVKGQVQKIQ